MAQTKADRQAAAKKGAATRERNKKRAQAKQSAIGGVTGAVRSLGDAAVSAGKSVATRARGGKK